MDTLHPAPAARPDPGRCFFTLLDDALDSGCISLLRYRRIRISADAGEWLVVQGELRTTLGTEALHAAAIELELATYACEDEGHEQLKARHWERLEQIGVQGEGPDAVAMANCPSCGTTLGRAVA